jgi:hypothetical protein
MHISVLYIDNKKSAATISARVNGFRAGQTGAWRRIKVVDEFHN